MMSSSMSFADPLTPISSGSIKLIAFARPALVLVSLFLDFDTGEKYAYIPLVL